jgi:tetratricopeptide (TPR) repeat protein
MKKHISIVILVFTFLQVFANKNEPNKIFSIANDLYSQGEYQQAIENYQLILDDGYESASLYYNIGNAHYKTGNIPAAILYLEKALKSDPSNDDIRFNLKLANLKIVDKIKPLPELPFKQWWNNLVFSSNANVWGWLTIQSLFLCALLLGAFMVVRNTAAKKIFFYSGFAVIAFTLLCFTLGYQQKKIISNSKYSIVVSPTITVLSAPEQNSTKLFVIHEGTKVQELDVLPNWIKIKLANGNVGWVKEEALIKI